MLLKIDVKNLCCERLAQFHFFEKLTRTCKLIQIELETVWLPILGNQFKKPRQQLQRKRLIKIELCVKLSLLRLFHVDHVVQNRRTALSLAWYKWFSCEGKEWKIYCCELTLSSEPQIWKFCVVVCQTTSKHCTKKRATRAARLFFFIQPIKSLIFGVVVDVAVAKS